MTSGDEAPSLVPATAPAAPAALPIAEAIGDAVKDMAACNDLEEVRFDDEAGGADVRAQALSMEEVAMDFDRTGDAEQACACYRTAADQYIAAASACPTSDRPQLSRRAGQLSDRVVYLQGVAGGRAVLPPEVHIPLLDRPDARSTSSAADLKTTEDSTEDEGWQRRVKQTASAAAMVGTGAVVLLHAPVVAAVVAAGTAVATLRKDGAGDAARAVGDAGLSAVAKAQQLEEENHISEKVSEKVRESLVTMKETADKYDKFGVVEKVEAARLSSVKAIQEFDSKHEVSTKVPEKMKESMAEAAEKVEAARISSLKAFQEFDSKHEVTTKVQEKAKESLLTVRETADKLGVTEKVEAARMSSLKAFQDFDRDYDVSNKVATGLSTATKGAANATAKLAGWFAKAQARAGK